MSTLSKMHQTMNEQGQAIVSLQTATTKPKATTKLAAAAAARPTGHSDSEAAGGAGGWISRGPAAAAAASGRYITKALPGSPTSPKAKEYVYSKTVSILSLQSYRDKKAREILGESVMYSSSELEAAKDEAAARKAVNAERVKKIAATKALKSGAGAAGSSESEASEPKTKKRTAGAAGLNETGLKPDGTIDLRTKMGRKMLIDQEVQRVIQVREVEIADGFESMISELRKTNEALETQIIGLGHVPVSESGADVPSVPSAKGPAAASAAPTASRLPDKAPKRGIYGAKVMALMSRPAAAAAASAAPASAVIELSDEASAESSEASDDAGSADSDAGSDAGSAEASDDDNGSKFGSLPRFGPGGKGLMASRAPRRSVARPVAAAAAAAASGSEASDAEANGDDPEFGSLPRFGGKALMAPTSPAKSSKSLVAPGAPVKAPKPKPVATLGNEAAYDAPDAAAEAGAGASGGPGGSSGAAGGATRVCPKHFVLHDICGPNTVKGCHMCLDEALDI